MIRRIEQFDLDAVSTEHIAAAEDELQGHSEEEPREGDHEKAARRPTRSLRGRCAVASGDGEEGASDSDVITTSDAA